MSPLGNGNVLLAIILFVSDREYLLILFSKNSDHIKTSPKKSADAQSTTSSPSASCFIKVEFLQ